MEIRFDATIDNEDLANINWIRFYINAALSRIPDAPQKRSKGSIMIAVKSKAVEYQDKIREAMDKLLFKGIVTTGCCFSEIDKWTNFLSLIKNPTDTF